MNLYFEESFNIVSEYNDIVIKNGFKNPFICHKNKICIYKPNTFIKNEPLDSIKRDVQYISTQQPNQSCEMKIKIELESFEFLKYITKAGVTNEADGRYQREVFGRLSIYKSEDINGAIIYILRLNRSQLVHGGKEGVKATPSLYTFHSHPYQAYLNHKTEYGFPSVSDYISMFIMYKIGMILHFVASIEGLYVIYVNPESSILNKPNDYIMSYIKTHMTMDRYKLRHINDYVKFINDSNLFKLQLIKWDNPNVTIDVQFNKTAGNCVIRD
jgi:hypothetical protein